VAEELDAAGEWHGHSHGDAAAHGGAGSHGHSHGGEEVLLKAGLSHHGHSHGGGAAAAARHGNPVQRALAALFTLCGLQQLSDALRASLAVVAAAWTFLVRLAALRLPFAPALTRLRVRTHTRTHAHPCARI
jgi:hypothetical protein